MAHLEREIPDPEQRRLVLNQVARLIPRPGGGLDFVELSGRAVSGDLVQLRKETRPRVREAILGTVREETVVEEGVLHEIDLDQRTSIIRDLDEGRETRCESLPEAAGLVEIAKDSLDHPGAGAGTRRKDPTRRQAFRRRVREMDVLGLDDDEPTSPSNG
jgi:hypothetical protein